MSLHQKVHFEADIYAHLAAHGWLYAEGDAAKFDRATGLVMPDLLAWVAATQPESFERLTKTDGPPLRNVLAERVGQILNKRGMLEMLQRGVAVRGLRKTLSSAIFVIRE